MLAERDVVERDIHEARGREAPLGERAELGWALGHEDEAARAVVGKQDLGDRRVDEPLGLAPLVRAPARREVSLLPAHRRLERRGPLPADEDPPRTQDA